MDAGRAGGAPPRGRSERGRGRGRAQVRGLRDRRAPRASRSARPHRGRARAVPRGDRAGRRRVHRPQHAPHRRAPRALAGVSRSRRAPDRARRARPRARRPRDELPAAPHAGDRDRPGRARAARAPRPVGVRLLRVPGRLRGRVPHDVGDAPTSPRRTARRASSRAAITGTTSCARTPDQTIAGRDAEGLGAALPRLAVPRRRREPFDAAAARHQRRLHAVVVAPGGEPVPRVPARGRA